MKLILICLLNLLSVMFHLLIILDLTALENNKNIYLSIIDTLNNIELNNDFELVLNENEIVLLIINNKYFNLCKYVKQLNLDSNDKNNNSLLCNNINVFCENLIYFNNIISINYFYYSNEMNY